MQVDYQKAEARPSPNFWPGNDGRDYIVVHATASGGVEEVPNFSAATGKSTTYAISRAGKVVQYVSEHDSHWGNCCTSGASPFVTNPNKPAGYNYNHNTIAIENEKYSNDNSESLETVQYEALLDLVRDIAARWKIPLVHGTPSQRGVIYHHDLDPVNRARCPGTFPYGTFFTDLNQGGASQPVKLDSNGCVITTPKSFQLETGESSDLCGPWSAVALAHAVPPGMNTTWSNEQIDQFTDDMVDKLFGPGGFNHVNFGGVMPADMITIFNYIRDTTGLIHYQIVPATLDNMYRALDAGYPGLFSCNEADLTAWNFTKNAWEHGYPWLLAAGHVLPFTGYDNNKNIKSPDELNNSYQGYWPVIYKAGDLGKSLSWMAVIQLVGPDKNNPWHKPIPSGDPASWPAGFNAQNFTGGGNMGVPTGWKDDGSILTAPNNVPVRSGFRSKVIAGWDANNYPVKAELARTPVEQANAALGPGTWQNFRFGALAYTQQRGVYVPWVGQELQWYMDNYDNIQKERDALKKQVSDLQAQLAQASGGAAIPQVVKDDITQLASHVTPAASMLDKLVKDAGL